MVRVGVAHHARSGNVADHPARTFDARPLPVDAEWPSHLEFAFSNRCNLACIQCSPDLSSTIRRQRGLPPLRSPYDDGFFAQIDRAAQEVRLRVAEWRFAQGDVAAALDEARLLADDVAQRGATEPWIDREAQKILASAASAPRLAASPPRRE